jgi:hypothetical protein
MGVSPQRRDDWEFAFQVRPVVVELDGRRLTISPQAAHLLLAELGRLPRMRHQAAEDTAAELMHGLAAGCAVSLDEDAQRCVLRAIEGVRVRGKLHAGLAALRLSLLHSAERVV